MIALSSDTAAYQSSSHFPILYYVSSQVSMGAFSQLSAFDILNWGECGNYIHLFIHLFIHFYLLPKFKGSSTEFDDNEIEPKIYLVGY